MTRRLYPQLDSGEKNLNPDPKKDIFTVHEPGIYIETGSRFTQIREAPFASARSSSSSSSATGLDWTGLDSTGLDRWLVFFSWKRRTDARTHGRGAKDDDGDDDDDDDDDDGDGDA